MLKIILLLLLTVFANALTLEVPLKAQNVLHDARVFIDTDTNRSAEEVLATPSLFKPFEENKINLGYTTEQAWVMFSLENNSSNTLRPVLEIDNPMLDYIHLYTFEETNVTSHRVKGVMFPLDFHGPLNFSFDLELEPHSSKHYLLHVSSVSCALYFHATVMEQQEFFTKELYHQMALALFFGIIIGLIVYNIFIYFFTEDIAYVYYVGYQIFVLLNYASYTTIGRHVFRHIAEAWMISIDAFLGVLYLMGIMFFMLLFTRAFLQLQQFRWIDAGIKLLGFLGVLILLLSSTCCYLIDAAAYLMLISSIYLVGISLYLVRRKQRHARYFVVAWGVSLFGTISLILYQMGLAPWMDVVPYLYEFGIVFEATLFSVILSQRINYVIALAKALDTQKVLTRELHHRVKNNLQFIISLYRLKFADVTDRKIKQKLRESENNLIAMSNIHQALYAQENLAELDTQAYFKQLIDAMRSSYQEKDISILLNCSVSLDPQKAIYGGIILNELVTNSFKYAFKEGEKGEIEIALYEESGSVHFEIADNGEGFEPERAREGFGLMMVKALVQGELHGMVEIESDEGTRYRIVWEP